MNRLMNIVLGGALLGIAGPLSAGMVPTLGTLLSQAQRLPQRALEVAKQVRPQTANRCEGVTLNNRWGEEVPDCKTVFTQPLVKTNDDVQALEDAGLTKAAQALSAQIRFLQRATPLYERYPVLKSATVRKFNEELEAATRRKTDRCLSYYNDKCQRWEEVWQELELTAVNDYDGIPPKTVLTQLAKWRKEFDTIQVAYITEASNRLVDPLLLGRIDGTDDYFVLAQWGEDISYQEILQIGR